MSQTRTVKLDPHVHSADSYDGNESVESLLNTAEARHLDGIVVTDHDRMARSRTAVSLAPEYELFAIPGIEVSTADGHLLGIGVTKQPPPGEPLDRSIERIRDQGGIAVIPHPFQWSRHGVPRSAITDCDGIEVLNACSLLNVRNKQARTFAGSEGYPALGGSDAHLASEVGQAYTQVECEPPVDSDSILDAIRQGNTEVKGSRSRKGQYLRKYVRNARVKTTSLVSKTTPIASD